jgi:hypothetical protein
MNTTSSLLIVSLRRLWEAIRLKLCSRSCLRILLKLRVWLLSRATWLGKQVKYKQLEKTGPDPTSEIDKEGLEMICDDQRETRIIMTVCPSQVPDSLLPTVAPPFLTVDDFTANTSHPYHVSTSSHSRSASHISPARHEAPNPYSSRRNISSLDVSHYPGSLQPSGYSTSTPDLEAARSKSPSQLSVLSDMRDRPVSPTRSLNRLHPGASRVSARHLVHRPNRSTASLVVPSFVSIRPLSLVIKLTIIAASSRQFATFSHTHGLLSSQQLI